MLLVMWVYGLGSWTQDCKFRIYDLSMEILGTTVQCSDKADDLNSQYLVA